MWWWAEDVVYEWQTKGYENMWMKNMQTFLKASFWNLIGKGFADQFKNSKMGTSSVPVSVLVPNAKVWKKYWYCTDPETSKSWYRWYPIRHQYMYHLPIPFQWCNSSKPNTLNAYWFRFILLMKLLLRDNQTSGKYLRLVNSNYL